MNAVGLFLIQNGAILDIPTNELSLWVTDQYIVAIKKKALLLCIWASQRLLDEATTQQLCNCMNWGNDWDWPSWYPDHHPLCAWKDPSPLLGSTLSEKPSHSKPWHNKQFNKVTSLRQKQTNHNKRHPYKSFSNLNADNSYKAYYFNV